MFESVALIFQVLVSLQRSPDLFLTHAAHSTTAMSTKATTMEALIEHFKSYTAGIRPRRGFAYRAVEAPKGEFGTGLFSDGSEIPFRCKIRTPAYHHMHLMSHMVQGHLFADLVTVLGSLDIVFGDVDR
jgi:NADH-quinone oxidoreductase subunit D